MKHVDIHKHARNVIRGFSKGVRAELGSALIKLQLGMILDLPLSRSMSVVSPGVSELRLRDSGGIRRVFYYLKVEGRILVFHAFTKKNQKTPLGEIETGRQRLRDMLGYGQEK